MDALQGFIASHQPIQGTTHLMRLSAGALESLYIQEKQFLSE